MSTVAVGKCLIVNSQLLSRVSFLAVAYPFENKNYTHNLLSKKLLTHLHLTIHNVALKFEACCCCSPLYRHYSEEKPSHSYKGDDFYL